MALCQTVAKHRVITKPDGQVGINKMEGGTIRGTLWYNFSLMYMCTNYYVIKIPTYMHVH